MFLNALPTISFLLLCLLFCSMDKLIEKKLISDFLASKLITGIFGTAILLWGLMRFYQDFNYIKFSFAYNPIAVVLKLLVIVYFIVCGFSISFKGYGEYLFNKNKDSQLRFNAFRGKLKSYDSFLAKIAIILIVIFLANTLLS